MNILPAELDKGQICSRPLTSTPSSSLLATAKLTSLETSFKNGHLHMLSRCEQQIVLCGKKTLITQVSLSRHHTLRILS